MSYDSEKLLEQEIITRLDWDRLKIHRAKEDWRRSSTLRKWGLVSFELHYKRIKREVKQCVSTTNM